VASEKLLLTVANKSSMKSKEIRRIFKDTGLFETEKLDNAVKEILLLFGVIHSKKFSVVSLNPFNDECEVVYDTDNLDDANKEYERLINRSFCVDDAIFGIINNETGREFQSGVWYE
jgi:hypothetical protein